MVHLISLFGDVKHVGENFISSKNNKPVVKVLQITQNFDFLSAATKEKERKVERK